MPFETWLGLELCTACLDIRLVLHPLHNDMLGGGQVQCSFNAGR